MSPFFFWLADASPQGGAALLGLGLGALAGWMSALGWWVAIGLAPQLSFWMWYTIVFGALFGTVATAIARRRGTAAA